MEEGSGGLHVCLCVLLRDKLLQKFVEKIRSAKTDAEIAGIIMRIYRHGMDDQANGELSWSNTK